MIATLCSMLVVFAMFAFTATPAVAQTSIDPQSLVGEWSAKWSGIWGTASTTLSGDYVLRIRKVEGEKVFGEVEWTNRGTTKSNLIGTFDGQRLTYGNGSLTVEGNRMTGTRPVTNFPRGINVELVKTR